MKIVEVAFTSIVAILWSTVFSVAASNFTVLKAAETHAVAQKEFPRLVKRHVSVTSKKWRQFTIADLNTFVEVAN